MKEEYRMKRLVSGFLSILLLLAGFSGCARQRRYTGDFSFRIRWGVEGQSSYDSLTDVLVKTTNASDPDRFKTKLSLSPEEITELTDLVSTMDLSAIPDAPESYEPYMTEGVGWALAKPSSVLELTLRNGQEEKTILCVGALSLLLEWDSETDDLYTPVDGNAEVFIALVRRMMRMIQTSEEWKALPEYEVLYQ